MKSGNVSTLGRHRTAVFPGPSRRPTGALRISNMTIAEYATEQGLSLAKLLGQLTQDGETKDPLTGLGDKASCIRYIHQTIAALQADGNGTVHFTFADLDRFKPINDRHGHLIGDKVLRLGGRAFLRTIRSTDRAYRYGTSADEFMIVSTGRRTNSAGLIGRIERAWQSLIDADDELRELGIVISISFGTSMISAETSGTPETLFEEAFRAAERGMYELKYARKHPVS